jgi:heterodisulfide reductase subunit C
MSVSKEDLIGDIEHFPIEIINFVVEKYDAYLFDMDCWYCYRQYMCKRVCPNNSRQKNMVRS